MEELTGKRKGLAPAGPFSASLPVVLGKQVLSQVAVQKHCCETVCASFLLLAGAPEDADQAPAGSTRRKTGAFAPGAIAGCGKPGFQRTLARATVNCKEATRWWAERFKLITRKDIPPAKATRAE